MSISALKKPEGGGQRKFFTLEKANDNDELVAKLPSFN
jgi:hypothetical protein